MTTIRVVWGNRTPIGRYNDESVRTMTREFGSAKKAAEFACDILYTLNGPECANAHSEKYYTVSRDKPRVRFDNNDRLWWVEVTWSNYPSKKGEGPIPARSAHTPQDGDRAPAGTVAE